MRYSRNEKSIKIDKKVKKLAIIVKISLVLFVFSAMNSSCARKSGCPSEIAAQTPKNLNKAKKGKSNLWSKKTRKKMRKG